MSKAQRLSTWRSLSAPAISDTYTLQSPRIGEVGLVATLLKNFAAYAAALAGYTVAIIASDEPGATGGPDAGAFMLAITRASEICIGIVSAGVILAATDFGGARRRLATLVSGISSEISGRFTRTLAMTETDFDDTQRVRRELARRVIALELPSPSSAIGWLS